MDITNCKLQIGLRVSLSRTPKVKILHFAFYILPFALLVISGCLSYQVGGEIQAGRSALKHENPKAALAHFQKAAELDPDYYLNFSLLNQGVWTYVGRAHYAAGNLPEARKALERARSRHEWDNIAKLYLGLTLARDGDRQRGIGEVETGLRGINNWLNYIDMNLHRGQFWDPGRDIRNRIEKTLAMIQSREVSLPELIASGEWVGRELEEEIERAKDDYRRDRDDDDDRDGGDRS